MSAGLRDYLLGLSAAALVCSLLLTLIPKGGVHRAAKLGCGLLMLLCALRPLKTFDPEDVSRVLARVQMQQDAALTGVEVKNRELVCAIISEKAAAYILDKAEELGRTLRVTVQAEDDGAGPYLSSVILEGSVDAAAKEKLTAYIESTFGIPAERQMWRDG